MELSNREGRYNQVHVHVMTKVDELISRKSVQDMNTRRVEIRQRG